MLAKEIMHSNVFTASPKMTLRELAKLLTERRITGAPVVGKGGEIVGVVSQTDLVRHEQESGPRKQTPSYHLQPEVPGEPASPVFDLNDPDNATVEDVMTPWAISFEEDTPIQEIARQMMLKKIHRVVITKDGKLAGIVTTMDLLYALLKMLAEFEGK